MEWLLGVFTGRGAGEMKQKDSLTLGEVVVFKGSFKMNLFLIFI